MMLILIAHMAPFENGDLRSLKNYDMQVLFARRHEGTVATLCTISLNDTLILKASAAGVLPEMTEHKK
jgi:hypothetical protein